MTIIITSIDQAASGFVRHRFVRALSASWVVLSVSGFLALFAGAAFSPGEDDGWIFTVIVGTIIFVLFAGVFLLATGLAGAIIDLVHRRLIAVVSLAVFGLGLLILPLAMLGGILELLDPSSVEAAEGGAHSTFETVAIIVMAALSTVVALETVRWAWWQLTVPDESFLATRGWRPPGWRLMSIFRRMLGLPAFVSNVGRDQLALSMLYFFVALLNVGIAAAFTLPFLVFTEIESRSELAVIVGIAVVLFTLLTLNVFGAGRWIAAVANRRATSQYQSVREWDARPPIVVLRTFEQDDERMPARVRHPLLRLPAGVSDPKTLDEILLEHASPYGPVIAIGDPRDPVPPLGAARIFVPGAGNQWQDVVRELVSSSQAVVMCPNDTEGVKWELDLVARKEREIRLTYVANPELPAETTLRLFRQVVPGGEALNPPAGQVPIAAFRTGPDQWRVLTTSFAPSVQSYTVAVNIALQALLGPSGTALKRPPRRRQAPHRAAATP